MTQATKKPRKHANRVRRPSPPAPLPHAGEGRRIGAALPRAGEGSHAPRPDQPPWLPVGIELDFVPPAVRQAIPLIIEPAYRQFVLQAADAMERSLGLTMVHLLWLELLSQMDLARDYAEVISVLKLPINFSGLMAECMKLVHAKLKVGAFLLRLQEFREKHGRLLMPCLPMQAYPGECRQVEPEWGVAGSLGDAKAQNSQNHEQLTIEPGCGQPAEVQKCQISQNDEQLACGRPKPGLQRGENGTIGENDEQLDGKPASSGTSGTENGPNRQNDEQLGLDGLKPGLQRGENGRTRNNSAAATEPDAGFGTQRAERVRAAAGLSSAGGGAEEPRDADQRAFQPGLGDSPYP